VIAIVIAAETMGDAIEEIFFNLLLLNNCNPSIVSSFSSVSVVIEGCCVSRKMFEFLRLTSFSYQLLS